MPRRTPKYVPTSARADSGNFREPGDHVWPSPVLLVASESTISESYHALKCLGVGFVASDGAGLGGGVGVSRNETMKFGNP